MIQTTTFALSKDIARLPYGPQGRSIYYYLGDISSQWESSHIPAKTMELVGSQSLPPDHLPAVKAWLGALTEEEQQFVAQAGNFLKQISKLASTAPTQFDPAPDLYETLLDTRILQRHTKFPCRVLDIGAGAGRHLLNLLLRPRFAGSTYCAVDSVGVPYTLQNLMMSALSMRDPAIRFVDTLDHEFARQQVDVPQQPAPHSLWHLPLWHANKLPDKSFDLILCNYVLDEIPAEDFRQIMTLIGRCLAPEGIVYCRGAQEKSKLKDLHLFGYGTYHQQDVTAAFLQQRLKVISCELLTATMTRVLARAESTRVAEAGPYTAFASDDPLIETMQRDFVRQNLDRIRAGRLRTLVWSDPGHAAIQKHLAGNMEGVPLAAVTNDHVGHEGPGVLGSKEVPLRDIAAVRPQAVIIGGTRTKLAIRELRENLAPFQLGPVMSFNYPIAFCYPPN